MPNRITTSEMDAWSNCPQLWWWKYQAGTAHCGIEPVGFYLPYLEGRFLHHTVAIYNRTGKMMKTGLLKWYDDQLTEFELTREDCKKAEIAKHRAFGACVGYRDTYPEDPSLNWLSIESPFEFLFKGYTFAGRIDGCYESPDGLVLREYKFLSKGSQMAPVALPLNLQRWMYTMAIKTLHGKWPVRVEFIYIFKTRISQKKGESQAEFEKRVIDQYTSQDDTLFYRQSIEIEASAVESIFAEIVQQRLLIMTSRKPWMNDRHCVRPASTPCPFLPACTALLQNQRQGWMAPQCIKLYRQKTDRHPELLRAS